MRGREAGSAVPGSPAVQRPAYLPDDPSLTVAPSGALAIDGCDVMEIIAEYGAPVWVISDSTIRSNLDDMNAEFAHHYPSVRVLYASKANMEPAVLQIVREAGAGLDVVTAGQIHLATVAGFEPADLVFNGNSKTLAELSWAIVNGIGMINVDSLDELDALIEMTAEHERHVDVAFRLALDPADFEADDPIHATQLRESKFGMPRADVLVAARRTVGSRWLSVIGVHSHLGFTAYGNVPYSHGFELDRRRRQVRQVMSLVESLQAELGIQATVINLGGGFRRGRPEGYGPARLRSFAPIDQVAQAIAEEIRSACAKQGLPLPLLMLEAGGYVVSDAVVFLAKVGFTKTIVHGDQGRDWAFLEDTSAYHFVRRLLADFYHHPLLANRPHVPPAGRITIAGATCAEDSVATDVPFPSVVRGDVVALLDQGAYAESISSDYCAIPLPAVVLARDGQALLIRRRTNPTELASQFFLPPPRALRPDTRPTGQ